VTLTKGTGYLKLYMPLGAIVPFHNKNTAYVFCANAVIAFPVIDMQS